MTSRYLLAIGFLALGKLGLADLLPCGPARYDPDQVCIIVSSKEKKVARGLS